MADKPIVLTKENVLAVMEGRKTMTRRLGGLQDINKRPNAFIYSGENSFAGTDKYGHIFVDSDGIQTGHDVQEMTYLIKPRYQVGDEIYIAEGYQTTTDRELNHSVQGKYLADGADFDVRLDSREWELFDDRQFPYRAMSGRFMYKSLARTFMKIIEVRAERLQDISESDCIAEGVIPKELLPCSPYEIFANRWNSTHGDGAWGLNSWVWVYRWEELKGEQWQR